MCKNSASQVYITFILVIPSRIHWVVFTFYLAKLIHNRLWYHSYRLVEIFVINYYELRPLVILFDTIVNNNGDCKEYLPFSSKLQLTKIKLIRLEATAIAIITFLIVSPTFFKVGLPKTLEKNNTELSKFSSFYVTKDIP